LKIPKETLKTEILLKAYRASKSLDLTASTILQFSLGNWNPTTIMLKEYVERHRKRKTHRYGT